MSGIRVTPSRARVELVNAGNSQGALVEGVYRIPRFGATVAETAELLLLSKSHVHDLLSELEERGVLVVREGFTTLIGLVSLARLVDGADWAVPVDGVPMVWTVEDTAGMLGVSGSQVRGMIDRGSVRAVRFGRAVRVSRRAVALRWGLAA